jgi:ribosomal protein L19E
MSASVSGTVDSTAFRAAIDAKIADDVASGKLTAKDARQSARRSIRSREPPPAQPRDRRSGSGRRHGAAGRRSWWRRWGRHQDRSLARGNGRRRDHDHGHHL